MLKFNLHTKVQFKYENLKKEPRNSLTGGNQQTYIYYQ